MEAETQRLTCNDCKYFPCCENVKMITVPICYGFVKRGIDTNCPICGAKMKQQYYGWNCPECGEMRNQNMERATPEDLY